MALQDWQDEFINSKSSILNGSIVTVTVTVLQRAHNINQLIQPK